MNIQHHVVYREGDNETVVELPDIEWREPREGSGYCFNTLRYFEADEQRPKGYKGRRRRKG